MAADATCQDLLKLSAAGTAITLAEQVLAGGFQSQREAQGGPNAARFPGPDRRAGYDNCGAHPTGDAQALCGPFPGE